MVKQVGLGTKNTGNIFFEKPVPSSTWDSALQFLAGNPATTVKIVLFFSKLAYLRDPSNISAKNTSNIAGDAKGLLSLFEVVAFGSKSFTKLMAVIHDKGFISRDASGAAQSAFLAVGEGVEGYAYLMKASIIFTGTAPQIAAIKNTASAIQGVGALFGFVSTGIELKDDYRTYEVWMENIVPSDGTWQTTLSPYEHNLTIDEKKIKADRAYWKCGVSGSEFLKTVTYVFFGAVTLMAFVAPAVVVPAEIILFLTACTIFFTATKHFAKEECAKLDAQEAGLAIEQLKYQLRGKGDYISPDVVSKKAETDVIGNFLSYLWEKGNRLIGYSTLDSNDTELQPNV